MIELAEAMDPFRMRIFTNFPDKLHFLSTDPDAKKTWKEWRTAIAQLADNSGIDVLQYNTARQLWAACGAEGRRHVLAHLIKHPDDAHLDDE